MTPTFFEDEVFQDRLVALLVWDIETCRTVAHLLEANDFKPVAGMKNGRSRWIAAEKALEYYRKYHAPIRRLLRSEVLAYAGELLGKRETLEAVTYCEKLLKRKVTGAESIVEKVHQLKQEILKAQVIQELTELHAQGELTNEKWLELSRKAIDTVGGHYHVSDYFSGLEERIAQRKIRTNEPPLFLIDPLDDLVRGPNRGQVALLLAPYKRGKSLFLSHLATAYTLQRWRSTLVTLEDPLVEYENRLDARVSSIPMDSLRDKPRTLKKRFQQYRRLVRTRLRILDGTAEKLSIDQIEQFLHREREAGFFPDALMIDYDDEIIPPRAHRDRRMEFADIYRELGKLAARHNIIVWTAAQTQRDTEHLKILSGDRLAEDISKVRKAGIAIGMGKGDWGDESIYLWVAANKFGRQHVGCHIVTDKSRMILYDAERTRLAAAQYVRREEEDD